MTSPQLGTHVAHPTEAASFSLIDPENSTAVWDSEHGAPPDNGHSLAR